MPQYVRTATCAMRIRSNFVGGKSFLNRENFGAFGRCFFPKSASLHFFYIKYELLKIREGENLLKLFRRGGNKKKFADRRHLQHLSHKILLQLAITLHDDVW